MSAKTKYGRNYVHQLTRFLKMFLALVLLTHKLCVKTPYKQVPNLSTSHIINTKTVIRWSVSTVFNYYYFWKLPPGICLLTSPQKWDLPCSIGAVSLPPHRWCQQNVHELEALLYGRCFLLSGLS